MFRLASGKLFLETAMLLEAAKSQIDEYSILGRWPSVIYLKLIEASNLTDDSCLSTPLFTLTLIELCSNRTLWITLCSYASILWNTSPWVSGSLILVGRSARWWIPMLNNRVTFSMGHTGASRKSPNDTPWETLNQTISRPISAHHWHWSGYEGDRFWLHIRHDDIPGWLQM